MNEQTTKTNVATFNAQDVCGGQTGVGLRWVLAISLIAIVVSFTAVTGVAIAGSV